MSNPVAVNKPKFEVGIKFEKNNKKNCEHKIIVVTTIALPVL